jgi:hypothetical protein
VLAAVGALGAAGGAAFIAFMCTRYRTCPPSKLLVVFGVGQG